MLKIKLSRMWWALLLTIALAYPISALAADVATELGMGGLAPPFTPEWISVWVFAIGGGVGASFIYIEEIDRYFKRFPALAKIIIGTLWGMATSLAVDALTDTPMGAIMLFTIFASSFSAPICAGFMAYIGNQKRQVSIYDRAKDSVADRVFGKREGGKDESS